MTLEKKLNYSSERTVAEKVLNFTKNDVLNSEKMTPKFLRIVETFKTDNLSKIVRDHGTPFESKKLRDEFIETFYEKLYEIPDNAPRDFTN